MKYYDVHHVRQVGEVMINRRASVAGFLLIVCAFALPQERKEYRIVNVPGTLESVLLGDAKPRVTRLALSSLTPPFKAKFFGVVAYEPLTRIAAKGIQIDLEGNDPWNNNRRCKESVYLDEDGLNEFERRVASLVRDVDNLQEHEELARNEAPSVVFAANTAMGKPKNGVFVVPIEFGYYWTGSRFGVYLWVPESQPAAGPHLGCNLQLPNADIAEVHRFVVEGRRWLSLTSPQILPN